MFTVDLEPNEKLVKIYRKAEATLIMPAIFVMIAIYVPIWFLVSYELLTKFIWFLAVWTVLVLWYGLKTYSYWLLNSTIVTDKRVISVTYNFPFGKKTSELLMRSIENITVITPNTWSKLMGIGTVLLYGSGHESRIELSNIHNPEECKQILWHTRGR